MYFVLNFVELYIDSQPCQPNLIWFQNILVLKYCMIKNSRSKCDLVHVII